MDIAVEVVETTGLGDRSYVVTGAGVAVVVDPQRDIDRVLDVVGDARVSHVLETHVHNDYVPAVWRWRAPPEPSTWCRPATTSATRRAA